MTNLMNSGPLSTSDPPDPMPQAHELRLSRLTEALGESGGLPAESLPAGVRAEFLARRAVLRAALAPCGQRRAAAILATLAAMAFRSEPSREVAAAIARQAITDICDLPEWALTGAARAFRLAEVGDGRWRPTAGELRTEALGRMAMHLRDLRRLDRVLSARLLPARRPATPEQRAAVLAGLRSLAGRLTTGAPHGVTA